MLAAFIPGLLYWMTAAICSAMPGAVQFLQTETNNINPLAVAKSVELLINTNIFLNIIIEYSGLFTNELFRWYYILLGIWLVDTVEFFIHLAYHRIPSLYLLHKVHHTLYTPYSVSALYNSVGESFITGSIMLAGFIIFQFSYYEYIAVTSLAYIKTVIDHSFATGYHATHHRLQNYNFQQPFFSYYDWLFGTRRV